MNDLANVNIDAVNGLAANQGALFAARGSGLYRSLDSGQNWQPLTASILPDSAIVATAVAVTDSTVFVGSNGALFRSADNGQSWSIAGLGTPAPLVTALAISPAFVHDGTVAAATAEDGVFMSTDGGSRWVPWNIGLFDSDIDCLCFSPDYASDQTIFAGTQSGIFCSRNGGKSWQETAFPMQFAPVLSMAITGQRLFAGTEQHGILMSADAGTTWQPLAAALTADAGAVFSLHVSANALFALTERSLLRILTATDEAEVVRHFTAQPALTMTGSADRLFIGLIDGQIASVSLTG